MSNWQSTPDSARSPYASPHDATLRPSPSKPLLWVVLCVGGLAGLCCCGGTIGAMMFGMNVLTEEVAGQLRDNPKFREHIGELQTMNIDVTRTTAADGDDTFIYRVKGSKGVGVITVKHITDDEGNEQIVEASLRLPDGQQVQIVP